ncbi:MAG: hypothetical protein IPP91_12255 [Betaproteobacteria bacterium]|nr:hypothetical protein [Betaproteobacteria bacterium]
MLIRFLLPLLLAGLSLIGDAFAQDQAFANRATDLKERPAADARTLAPLAADAPVKVLARQGAWTQVEAGTQRGWVRAFHLRFPSTVETSSSGSGITSLFGFGNKKGPETSKVATLGIRGLTPEDFKNASPDPAALKKMQSWRSDKASAERFAREAKLAPVAVAYAGGGS